jgi:hypothetical protein
MPPYRPAITLLAVPEAVRLAGVWDAEIWRAVAAGSYLLCGPGDGIEAILGSSET